MPRGAAPIAPRHRRRPSRACVGLTGSPVLPRHSGRAEFERAICTCRSSTNHARNRSTAISVSCSSAFILEVVNPRRFARAIRWFRWPPDSSPKICSSIRRSVAPRTAPTELDLWRGRLLLGEVHDENRWELGGAAGHAGCSERQPAAVRMRATCCRRPEVGGRGAVSLAVGSRTLSRAPSGNRQCRGVRARSGGTRCCRPRHAARACRRALRPHRIHRNVVVDRSMSRIFTWCSSPTAFIRRAPTTRSSRSVPRCMTPWWRKLVVNS